MISCIGRLGFDILVVTTMVLGVFLLLFFLSLGLGLHILMYICLVFSVRSMVASFDVSSS